ncbi:MAG TPA: UDP-glucose 4-epimerase GalE [Candidatus Binatia bacterium]|nr:UDP-glucose 4-epimerase GalE [Candidatus Binatia bacterium]
MSRESSVLVVGGAGYIGSHAARVLRSHGYDVLIFDNLSRGHRFAAEGFELIEADIADRAHLSQALKRVAGVMHFAADSQVGESVEHPRKYFFNNVEKGLALLNAVVDAGVRNFIFSSTCAVYGIPGKMPITEDTPRQPVNPYGISKLFFENALESYGRAYGLRSMSLRYFNAAGADESGKIGEVHEPETHLIPCALKAITGDRGPLQLFGNDYPTPDGTCVRDYIHVNDLAEAHVQALKLLQDGALSAQYNLGTGIGASVQQVIATIEEVTGSKVPRQMGARRAGDPPELIADPSRAQKALSWKATRSLRDIIATAWQWEQKARRDVLGTDKDV